MSMPSSKELVATTARSRPALRASSISARTCLLTEPWWARARSSPPPASNHSSLRRAVSFSAARREFANTSVDRALRIESRISFSTWGQGSFSGGVATRTSQLFPVPGATTTTSRSPPRKAATFSTGRTVADRATRCTSRSASRSRRSRLRARWVPRLEPATAWISSTITVSTSRRVSRAEEVSIRYSDSGVVINTSGGLRRIRSRSRAGVSPERTPTVTSETLRPCRPAISRIPASGTRRLRFTSTPSAFSGET